MENLMSLDRKRAIEELERGRELATQLRRVIQGDNTTPFAQDLADKVERSFSNSLLLLNLTKLIPASAVADQNDAVSEFHHHHQQQHLTDSSCRLPAKSDDSEDSCKSTLAVHHNNKERRGCYKRRRTSQSWEMDSESPIEDGHAWRKYGQKTIMNAKYPRSYFRCTHKFDQGCQATKQVQRIQEPMMYKTIYYGNHTCNRNLLNPEIILDSEESPSTIDHHHHHHSSIILSFDNNNNNNVSLSSSTSSKQSLHLPFLSPSSTSSIINNDGPFTRQECKEEIPSPSLEDNKNNINHYEEEEEYLISEHDAVIIPHELYDSVDFTSDDVLETFGF